MRDVLEGLFATFPNIRAAANLFPALAEETAVNRAGELVLLDSNECIEALTLALAILIEAAPNMRTPATKRGAAVFVAEKVRGHFKALDLITERTGVPLLEMIQAYSLPEDGTEH